MTLEKAVCLRDTPHSYESCSEGERALRVLYMLRMFEKEREKE